MSTEPFPDLVMFDVSQEHAVSLVAKNVSHVDVLPDMSVVVVAKLRHKGEPIGLMVEPDDVVTIMDEKTGKTALIRTASAYLEAAYRQGVKVRYREGWD